MEASPHCSVRLECVMHAASVHPEPGSNSRKFSIITRISARHNLKLEFPFASFEFSRFTSFVFKGIVEISFCLVVQFSRTVLLSSLPRSSLPSNFPFQVPLAPLTGQLDYSTTLLYLLSIPFSTFFKTFFLPHSSFPLLTSLSFLTYCWGVSKNPPILQGPLQLQYDTTFYHRYPKCQ